MGVMLYVHTGSRKIWRQRRRRGRGVGARSGCIWTWARTTARPRSWTARASVHCSRTAAPCWPPRAALAERSAVAEQQRFQFGAADQVSLSACSLTILTSSHDTAGAQVSNMGTLID